ncbi:MAG: MFS transporter [Desulfobacteraceae bacterium]|nr:MFS transporter [Desulfobacteraceae bacterium]
MNSKDSEADPNHLKNNKSTFVALKIPAYRIYFGVLLMQTFAMNMQMVARSWFIYELSGSAIMLGAISLCSALPLLTVSLFGGVLADRMRKKDILVAAQIASALVAFMIAVSITLGKISWVHLFIAAFLQGVVMSLMMPARQAIIHELVGEDTLMNAIALSTAAMNLLRLTAPAFAGFFIALWDIEGVYYIMSVLYMIGFFVAILLPKTKTIQFKNRGTVHEVKDVLRYIRGNKNVMAILFLTLVGTILSMPYMFLLPIFAKDIFMVEAASFGTLVSLPVVGSLLMALTESSARQGLLISISGIGALAGSLIIASMSNKNRGLFFLLSLLLSSISLVIFSTTSSYLLALVVFIPLGFGHSGRLVLSNTLLQSNTDDQHRGRVLSVYYMNWGITLSGVFLVSVLADLFGIRLALGGSAALLAVVTLYYLFFTPRIRSLD